MVEGIFSWDPVSTVIVSPSRTVVTRFHRSIRASTEISPGKSYCSTTTVVCFLQNVMLATNALLLSELYSNAAMAGNKLPGSKSLIVRNYCTVVVCSGAFWVRQAKGGVESRPKDRCRTTVAHKSLVRNTKRHTDPARIHNMSDL